MIGESNFFNRKLIVAFITQTCISHSYKVETIKDIVANWNELNTGIVMEDNIDLLSGVLTCGRLMVLKEDINTPAPINAIIKNVRVELEKAEITVEGTDAEFIQAYLTSAIVENRKRTTTVREIIPLYKDILKSLPIRNDFEILCGFLTAGRILELKQEVPDAFEAGLIYNQIYKEFKDSSAPPVITQQEYASAIITAAYVEITPKLEKIRDIINTWDWTQKNVEVQGEVDLICAILAAGRIKDLDAKHMMIRESIRDIIQRIKDKIEK